LFYTLLIWVMAVSQQPSAAAPQISSSTRPQPLAGGAIETPHVTIETSVQSEPVTDGSRVALVVAITPKPKMHVYSPQQKDYIPVSIALDANPALTLQAPVFPKPQKMFFAPLKETQLVYSKPFKIVQNVVIRAVQPGTDEIRVAGRVRYQACDDAICYLPKDVPVSWVIRVKPSSVQ
jgi:DsbC/DsbD-like thiol-disulfide interchange protein